MARRLDGKRQHSPEFKVEAVRAMQERMASGVTLKRAGEELEIDPDMLRVWARAVDAAPEEATAKEIFPGHGGRRAYKPTRESRVDQPMTLEEELRRLRRENERLRMERDFLKKAAAFFAKESR